MRALPLPLLLAVFILCASGGNAAAQASKPIRHTVVKGDTLELLAAEYYGSRKHAIYIMKANRMTHPRPLRPREVLKVPVARQIIARRGDSFDGLAKTHLGDERRGAFLATYNKINPEEGLAAGQTLRIPFHVLHTTERDLSLEEISLSYFGDRSATEMIQRYNFLEKRSAPKGTKLAIPVINVKAVDSTPDSESEELVNKRRREQALAKDRLNAAGPKWRTGDYREVIALLTGIDSDFLDASQAIAVGVLLGGAYVATGDNASAKAVSSRTSGLYRTKSCSSPAIA